MIYKPKFLKLALFAITSCGICQILASKKINEARVLEYQYSSRQKSVNAYLTNSGHLSYENVNDKLACNSPLLIPPTNEERNQLLNYLRWFGNFTVIMNSDREKKWFVNKWRSKFLRIFQNIYVQDQLLTNHKQWSDVLTLANIINQHPDKNDQTEATVEQIEEANNASEELSKFLYTFDEETKKCKVCPDNGEEYLLECEYTKYKQKVQIKPAMI